jgi:acyl-CoA thioester hydrolase
MTREARTAPTGHRAVLPITVRWAECDAAGILYHARVFDWFSEGRLAWLRGIGHAYYDDWRARGIDLLVREANATFDRAMRPGDDLSLVVWVDGRQGARLRFRYTVRHQGHVTVEGFTEHVFVKDGRAINLVRVAADLDQAVEEAMTAVPSPSAY